MEARLVLAASNWRREQIIGVSLRVCGKYPRPGLLNTVI